MKTSLKLLGFACALVLAGCGVSNNNSGSATASVRDASPILEIACTIRNIHFLVDYQTRDSGTLRFIDNAGGKFLDGALSSPKVGFVDGFRTYHVEVATTDGVSKLTVDLNATPHTNSDGIVYYKGTGNYDGKRGSSSLTCAGDGTMLENRE